MQATDVCWAKAKQISLASRALFAVAGRPCSPSMSALPFFAETLTPADGMPTLPALLGGLLAALLLGAPPALAPLLLPPPMLLLPALPPPPPVLLLPPPPPSGAGKPAAMLLSAHTTWRRRVPPALGSSGLGCCASNWHAAMPLRSRRGARGRGCACCAGSSRCRNPGSAAWLPRVCRSYNGLAMLVAKR